MINGLDKKVKSDGIIYQLNKQLLFLSKRNIEDE